MNTKKLSLVVLLSVVPFAHAAEAAKKEEKTEAWYVTKAGNGKVKNGDAMQTLFGSGFIASVEAPGGDLQKLAEQGYPTVGHTITGYNGSRKQWVRYEDGKVTGLEEVEFEKVAPVHQRLVDAAERLQALEEAKYAEQIEQLRKDIQGELAETNTKIAEFLKSKKGATAVVDGLVDAGNRDELRRLATTLATMDDTPFVKEDRVNTLAQAAAKEEIEAAKAHLTELAVAAVFAKLVDSKIIVKGDSDIYKLAPSTEGADF